MTADEVVTALEETKAALQEKKDVLQADKAALEQQLQAAPSAEALATLDQAQDDLVLELQSIRVERENLTASLSEVQASANFAAVKLQVQEEKTHKLMKVYVCMYVIHINVYIFVLTCIFLPVQVYEHVYTYICILKRVYTCRCLLIRYHSTICKVP